jgi:aspartyl-tRNA(Asn)/glutamyl-tRNA(Gln) amidotransferase subunit B
LVVTWEVVIGLECHVQLATESKLFSASSSAFGGTPNSHTDPPVLGLPGALPVLNRRAVELAVRLGLATGSTIRRRSRFARKHYFYPDLPKGYQISQYDEPICEGGHIGNVRLTRIHLEEDAGKSLHAQGHHSLVDLNRAGVPLVEVVSEPDLRSAAEAGEYMRALRQLVRWLGISDGNMEEGSLRCDANVSLRPLGETKLGTKTELKNINSFRYVEKAIEYEVARQTQILDGGGKIVQETRLWDPDRGVSASMRSKEEAHYYRYFPDPDLPPVVVSEAQIEKLRAELPELPAARRRRFVETMALTEDDARVLTDEKALADYFDEVVRLGAEPKRAANWIQSELLRVGLSAPVTPAALAELLALIAAGTISGKIAKDVFAKMLVSGESPKLIVEREGLVQVSDTGAIEAAARDVIAANPKQVEQYRGGKPELIGFFVGHVMKATQGKANPGLVNEILRKLLG